MIYLKELITNGESHFRLFRTKFKKAKTKAGKEVFPQSALKGFGDPYLSSNGDYLIFTGYDPKQWGSTCDLYLAFWKGKNWGKPIKLSNINSAGPDFSPTVSPDGIWLYYRKNYVFMKVPFEPIYRGCLEKMLVENE